ncbi:hypothetical protein LTR94_028269, partial [Friedmanniomyces endolithicus]
LLHDCDGFVSNPRITERPRPAADGGGRRGPDALRERSRASERLAPERRRRPVRSSRTARELRRLSRRSTPARRSGSRSWQV